MLGTYRLEYTAPAPQYERSIWTARIFEEDGRLMGQLAGWRAERLRRQGENSYAFRSVPYFRISFEIEDERATAMRLHAGPHSQAGPRLGLKDRFEGSN